jgi:phage tail-like protein
MANYYPPWGFYFKVVFNGMTPDVSKDANESSFQSVSGLSVEYDFESYREGGENRFEHKLPVRTKYGDLVLKRGMLADSKVIKWLLDAFQNRKFSPVDITVTLMNEKSEPLQVWNVVHAIPKKWVVSDLNANENSVVVETMELSYRYFTQPK